MVRHSWRILNLPKRPRYLIVLCEDALKNCLQPVEVENQGSGTQPHSSLNQNSFLPHLCQTSVEDNFYHFPASQILLLIHVSLHKPFLPVFIYIPHHVLQACCQLKHCRWNKNNEQTFEHVFLCCTDNDFSHCVMSDTGNNCTCLLEGMEKVSNSSSMIWVGSFSDRSTFSKCILCTAFEPW